MSNQPRSRRSERISSIGQSHQSSVAGFALLEVLITLVIVGVISLLMTIFLSQARSISRMNQDAQNRAELEAAMRFLVDDIRSAELLPLMDSTPDSVSYFQGKAAQLRFASVSTAGFQVAALREISIQRDISDVADPDALVLLQQRRRTTGDNGTTRIILLPNVTQLDFEYRDGETNSWLGNWDIPRRLPIAVQIHLTMSKDGKLYTATAISRLALASH